LPFRDRISWDVSSGLKWSSTTKEAKLLAEHAAFRVHRVEVHLRARPHLGGVLGHRAGVACHMADDDFLLRVRRRGERPPEQ